jgi:hypothetical protein
MCAEIFAVRASPRPGHKVLFWANPTRIVSKSRALSFPHAVARVKISREEPQRSRPIDSPPPASKFYTHQLPINLLRYLISHHNPTPVSTQGVTPLSHSSSLTIFRDADSTSIVGADAIQHGPASCCHPRSGVRGGLALSRPCTLLDGVTLAELRLHWELRGLQRRPDVVRATLKRLG